MNAPTASKTRLVAACALVGVASLHTACTPWTVVKASGPPSALEDAKAVSVAYDDGSLLVGGVFASSPVAEYRQKDPEAAKKFDEVLEAANKAFYQAFSAGVAGLQVSEAAAGAADGDGVRLTVKHTFIQPGKYAVVAAVPTVTRAQLVFERGGAVVDVIEVNADAPATITTPAIHQRINTCGERMGSYGAKFLNQAVAGKK